MNALSMLFKTGHFNFRNRQGHNQGGTKGDNAHPYKYADWPPYVVRHSYIYNSKFILAAPFFSDCHRERTRSDLVNFYAGCPS